MRLWLRLLTCSGLVERAVRRRLREEFAATLPRFDLMAALDRAPDGLTMGELSLRASRSPTATSPAWSSGWSAKGCSKRAPLPTDRSAAQQQGGARPRRAAPPSPRWLERHAGWIDRLLGDLSDGEIEQLMDLLARLRARTVESNSLEARS